MQLKPKCQSFFSGSSYDLILINKNFDLTRFAVSPRHGYFLCLKEAQFLKFCQVEALIVNCIFIFRMIWGKYRKYKMRTYINTLQKTFK